MLLDQTAARRPVKGRFDAKPSRVSVANTVRVNLDGYACTAGVQLPVCPVI